MRILYNILWIENEKDWLEPSLEFVKDVIEENGFELNCIDKSSEAEIESLLKEDEPLKEFDLILVDFQLDGGDRGNKIIENIRNHNIYTDVLFYSQDPEGIRQAIKDHWLDGIYCSSRNLDDFQHKFEKVFKTTVKKIQHISTMRGLVLSETSQLDNIIEEILVDFFATRSEDDQLALKKYIIKDLLTESHNSNSAKIKALNHNMKNEELVNHRLFDAYKKMRTTGKILEILNNKNVIDKATFIQEYGEEVIDMRNNLAHANEGLSNGKKVLKTIKGDKEFDERQCIGVRNNLKKHFDYLSSIKEAIKI